MTNPSPDALRIYLVWAPEFAAGGQFARQIAHHFDSLGIVRERRQIGVPVRIRTAPPEGGEPRAIDWSRAHTNVVVFLSERSLRARLSGPWKSFYEDLRRRFDTPGSSAYSVNIAVTKAGLTGLPGQEQVESELYFEYGSRSETALEDGAPSEPMRRLLLALISICGAFLRQDLATSGLAAADFDPAEPIKVFISHTHAGGRALAVAIADRLRALSAARSGVAPFLDSETLRVGKNYRAQFEHTIRNGVFIAIHTDDYGERRFCRWEMVCAKRHQRPIVIASALTNGEARSFPYAGNTPTSVVSIDAHGASPAKPSWFAVRKPKAPSGPDARTIDNILLAVMSESLRFLIFHASAAHAGRELGRAPDVILPRPPELADIAAIVRYGTNDGAAGERIMVYPDPPLDTVEAELIEAISSSSGFRALSMSQFKCGTNPTNANTLLRERLIGVSASNVDDKELQSLGFFKFEDSTSPLWQGLAELVTVVAQLGGRLSYGGDLRQGGITRRLFDEVANAYHTLEGDKFDRFVNYLAWSVWRAPDDGARFRTPPAKLFAHVVSMELLGSVEIFLPDAATLQLTAESSGTDDPVVNVAPGPGAPLELAGDYNEANFEKLYRRLPYKTAPDALATMRTKMAADEDGRILVGGRLGDGAKPPGVGEEALQTVRAGKLLLPLAAFGGVTHDVAFALGLLEKKLIERPSSPGEGYERTMAALREAAPQYHEVLTARGVDLNALKALARTDSPPAIAEYSRRIVLAAFPPAKPS
jgi:hypothetical protein